VAAQRQRLQRGDAHALAVDRVEAAHRITHHQQPVGEAAQPLVPVADARREAEGDRVVQRLGVADRLVDVREPKRPGEGEEAVGVGGWVVTQHAGQGHHPPATLDQQQRAAAGMPGRRAVQHTQVVAEGIGRQPVGPGGVAQPDAHLLGLRPRVAQYLQPHRSARAPPGGVDHQVSAEHLLGAAAGPAPHPRAGDAATIGRGGQPEDVAGV
jgi:hypothetical protein